MSDTVKHQRPIRNNPGYPRDLMTLAPSARIRATELAAWLGVTEVTVWRWSRDGGRLPKPYKLSPNVTVWIAGEIQQAVSEGRVQ